MKKKTDTTSKHPLNAYNWKTALISKPFFVLYSFYILLDQLAICFFEDQRFITKPLIISALIFLLLKTKAPKYWLPPIIFSLLGDIALLFEGPIFFVLGLGSFLLAHLLYVGVFIKKFNIQLKGKSILMIALILSIIASSFLLIYWSRFGALKIPVLLYVIVLSLMAIIGLTRYGTKGIGLILFVISDLMLGIATFHPLNHTLWSMGIMLSYAFAQYYILRNSPYEE